jgi:hypothetical protein
MTSTLYRFHDQYQVFEPGTLNLITDELITAYPLLMSDILDLTIDELSSRKYISGTNTNFRLRGSDGISKNFINLQDTINNATYDLEIQKIKGSSLLELTDPYPHVNMESNIFFIKTYENQANINLFSLQGIGTISISGSNITGISTQFLDQMISDGKDIIEFFDGTYYQYFFVMPTTQTTATLISNTNSFSLSGINFSLLRN